MTDETAKKPDPQKSAPTPARDTAGSAEKTGDSKKGKSKTGTSKTGKSQTGKTEKGNTENDKTETKEERRARKAAERAEHLAATRAARKAERNARRNAPLPVVVVEGPAQRRRLEAGQWVGLGSLVLLVVLPGLIAAWYLWTRAADQYAAHLGITVQQEAGITPAAALTGLAVQIGGQGPRSDTDILNEYLRSPALVAQLAETIDLRAHYAAPHATDPVFALRPAATRADLNDYWWRILYVTYDDTTGLIDLRVQAFDPDTAVRIAEAIRAEATRVVTELAAQARADTVRFAEEDVERAQERLREAREALIAFQSRSQILDPETDVAGRLGIVTTLQSQLAEALISLDALRETTLEGDPRISTAERRIAVIRARIDTERSAMAIGAGGASYPELLAEYQQLAAERRHAAERLTEAFVALDAARSEAARQNRYVIAYVAPTLADTAVYPRRWFWLAATLALGFLAWFVLNIVYVSVRDRR